MRPALLVPVLAWAGCAAPAPDEIREPYAAVEIVALWRIPQALDPLPVDAALEELGFTVAEDERGLAGTRSNQTVHADLGTNATNVTLTFPMTSPWLHRDELERVFAQAEAHHGPTAEAFGEAFAARLGIDPPPFLWIHRERIG